MPIQKADPAHRRKFFVLFVAMTVIGLAAIQWGVPLLQENIANQEPESAIRLVQLLLSLMFVPMVPMAYYTYRLAMRVNNSQQFPPPGMKVIRDTQILQGKAARRRGNQLLAASILLGVAAFIGLVYLPYLIAQIGTTFAK